MKQEKMRKYIQDTIKRLTDTEEQMKRRKNEENKKALEEEIKDTGIEL